MKYTNEQLNHLNSIKDSLRVYLADYLMTNNYCNGINLHTTKRNTFFKCFEHDDTKPSMTYNSKGYFIKCFVCQTKYDLFDLIQKDYKLQNKYDAIAKAEEIFKGKKIETANQTIKPKKKLSNYFRALQKNSDDPAFLDYMHKRGISDKTIKDYSIMYDAFKGRVIFKLVDYYKVVQDGNKFTEDCLSYTGRTIREVTETNPKYLVAEDKPKFLYDPGIAFSGKSNKRIIFIVEGHFDALSFLEVLPQLDNNEIISVIALGGIEEDKLLSKILLMPYKAELKLVVNLDRDNAGRNSNKKIYDLLTKNNIKCFDYNPTLYSCKDYNDSLIKDRNEFIKRINTIINYVKEK